MTKCNSKGIQTPIKSSKVARTSALAAARRCGTELIGTIVAWA
jgi:hypothetical protein